MNTLVNNMLFFRDEIKRSMCEGEEGENKGGEATLSFFPKERTCAKNGIEKMPLKREKKTWFEPTRGRNAKKQR